MCIAIATGNTGQSHPAWHARKRRESKGPPQLESKRIFGIIPNYRTSPSLIDFEPLTAGEKPKMATDDSFDRGAFILAGLFAGQAQLTNANRFFGQGAAGYNRYYGSLVII
jgi:hypothetical protein